MSTATADAVDAGDETGPLSLEGATNVVHDGLELLETVEKIYYEAANGFMKVETERGSFTVVVALDNPTIADKHGGTWGEHPTYSVSEWQEAVERSDTRLGYWGWVEGQIEANA